MENHQLTFWNSNYQIDENSFAPTCQFSSYDYFRFFPLLYFSTLLSFHVRKSYHVSIFNFCRGNASDGFHWPYEFPLQDSYFDVVPFMKCYYPHDILYETLPLEPTPLSFQGCKYQHEFFQCVCNHPLFMSLF